MAVHCAEAGLLASAGRLAKAPLCCLPQVLMFRAAAMPQHVVAGALLLAAEPCWLPETRSLVGTSMQLAPTPCTATASPAAMPILGAYAYGIVVMPAGAARFQDIVLSEPELHSQVCPQMQHFADCGAAACSA